MEYNYLGNSGLQVSPVCLGAMMFGGRTSEALSGRIIASAYDAGINFIDTADAYVKGESERIVGKFIRRRRDHWVLATKAGAPVGPGPMQRGLSRKHLMTSIDASLKRLNTDYIDVYYFHKDDAETPLEESIAAVTDAITAGKLRHWGVSNFLGWRIGLAASTAQAMGAPPPVVCQPYYNAMNRMPEQEVLPACEYHGLGVVPFSPLARGVLTGKYGKSLKKPLAGSRAGRNDPRMMATEWRQENLDMALIIKDHAEARGMTAGQFALNWVLNNAIITSVLAGPRTMGQWKEYLGALKHGFTSEDEALINSLVPLGHPSTPGYSDPQYPFQGRQPWTGID
jgi:aryl-alcohol dehydrogenase-like predicted oxidoreductase